MFCPQCRAEIPNDAKYCIKCSHYLTITANPSIKKQSQDSLDGIGTTLSRKGLQDSIDGIGTLFGGDVDDDSFKVGTLFANRYEVMTEGHKGGMGAVYKCKDTKLNEIVALKVIHPRLLNSPQALSRFRQEVSISRKLQHANIVRVFNLEEYEGKEYFTMEWIDGTTLREIINKRRAEKRLFSLQEAENIMLQLCDAMQYAHQHTIHRDIKPENILICDERGLKVKISDFGIAKMLSPSQLTSTSMQMGTPYYMAPEQKKDAANVDARADIYALGVVLFELLTLENTVSLKMPSKINTSLPPRIDSVIQISLEPNPDNRYQQAKELADALRAGEVDLRKKWPLWVYIAVGSVLMAVLAGYSFIHSKPTEVPSMTAGLPKESNGHQIDTGSAKQLGSAEPGIGEPTPKHEKAAIETSGENSPTSRTHPASVGQPDRASEFRALVNKDIYINPTKPNIAIVVASEKSGKDYSAVDKLYSLLRNERVNVITNLFKVAPFKSKGFFREVFDGDTDLLKQSDTTRKVNYLLLGNLSYSFKKGAQLDSELVSCNITFNYKVINTQNNVVKSDSIRVIGPGFSEEAALERGLEIIKEQYSDRILISLL